MRKILCFLIAFTMIISTGCTSNLKVDEKKVKEVSDKITEKMIGASNKTAEKKETHKLITTNSTGLIIDSMVGDIKISCTESTEAVVDVIIKATSDKKETAEKIIENYNDYKVETDLNNIKIDTTKKFDKINFADGISVDLNVTIPKNIKTITIKSNVGDINIDNFSGDIKEVVDVGDTTITNTNASYNIKTNVGELNLHNCLIREKSEFYSNTGDIEISATDISDADNIVVDVKTGDIKISLPDSSNYKADINEFLKEQKYETHGNGKTAIKLTAHVGEIEIN